MWNGIDRRKFPRIRHKCIIKITRAESSKTIATYTENIGVGGICVILKDDLGLFQGVNLELDLENGSTKQLKCSGTVVWVVKKHDVVDKKKPLYDIGIEFVDLDDEGRERLFKIIEKQLQG
ncbi:PilZ domain-containing protein [Candidatus Omnitrophota bacterium]